MLIEGAQLIDLNYKNACIVIGNDNLFLYYKFIDQEVFSTK